MTRFKELQRIKWAMAHKNANELEWAGSYCKMRRQLAQRQDHRNYWLGIEKIEKKVRATLANIDQHSG